MVVLLCSEARNKGMEMLGNLNNGVVYERNYAFNWIVNNVIADWDKIEI